MRYTSNSLICVVVSNIPNVAILYARYEDETVSIKETCSDEFLLLKSILLKYHFGS